MLALLAGKVQESLQHAGIASAIVALAQASTHVDVILDSRMLPTRAQQRSISTMLRSRCSAPRWMTPTTLRLPLPAALPTTAPCCPCVPVLRRKRVTLWWSLPHTGHIVLAGAATATLVAMVTALNRVSAHHPLTLALDDREDALRALDLDALRLEATPDAVGDARLQSLRIAWAAQHGQPYDPAPPHILVVVAPDEVAWRDLAPLLTTQEGGVHALVLLGEGPYPAEAREACHRLPVVEVGSVEAPPLPEAYRPPGFVPPRPGETLAWRSHRVTWRGRPIDQ